jgi:hypothetical protein
VGVVGGGAGHGEGGREGGNLSWKGTTDLFEAEGRGGSRGGRDVCVCVCVCLWWLLLVVGVEVNDASGLIPVPGPCRGPCKVCAVVKGGCVCVCVCVCMCVWQGHGDGGFLTFAP